MDLHPRKDGKENELKCINCGKPALFEYMYEGIGSMLKSDDFCLCMDCAKMIGSNIIKDVLRKEINFEHDGNNQEFIEILKKTLSKL